MKLGKRGSRMRLVLAFACAVMLTCLGAVPGHADKRVALVIGNSAYRNAPPLPNPRNDAEDVAAALKRTGFETIVGLDLDKAKMEDAAINFARAARTADVAVFYYAGHAIQYAGVNYLAPIDAKLTDEADLRRMIRVDEIVADLQQAKTLRILVLDSCRENPLADQLKRTIGASRTASIGRGLARIDSPQGMIIAYATQAGSTAADGHGRNSPYTAAFLKHIEEAEEIGTIFRRTAADVYEATGRTQLPELSLSFIGEFYLRGRLDIAVPVSRPTPDPCIAAGDHWKSAEAIGSVAAFEDHLARFPNCTFAGLAKARIERLNNKGAAVAPSVPPAGPPPAPAVQPVVVAPPTVLPGQTPPQAAPKLDARPASKPRIRETQATRHLNFENWAVTCNEFAEGPRVRRCSALLQILQQNTNQVVFTWTVALDERKQLVSVMQTPTGVVIPLGVELRVGKLPSQKIPFASCDTGRCIATTTLDANLLREMTISPTAEAVIQGSQGNTVQFNIQLKGFDRAYAILSR